MPSKRPKIVIYTDQEIIDKLDIIAENNDRSRANMSETILKQFIKNYESEHGNITIGDVTITGNSGNISIGSNNK